MLKPFAIDSTVQPQRPGRDDLLGFEYRELDAMWLARWTARAGWEEGRLYEVTALIHDRLEIPVYGIGAGPLCDGQVLIVSDVLGIFQTFTPKFVKQYARLAEEMKRAFAEYAEEVRNGTFPGPEHVYPMMAGEAEKLDQL
ncbi:MAG: hypothetical protein GX597_24655 [Anaerolineaceae bacterium]|nr:hypothetical protein [Anaerolineaceae bacterium]